MPSLAWYARRLRAMPPGEIAWRLGAQVRELRDRITSPLRRQHLRYEDVIDHDAAEGRFCARGFSCDWPDPQRQTRGYPDEWRNRLVWAAERILSHRMSFLGAVDCDLGAVINWNFEYEAGRSCPMDVSSRIDYRDYGATGDAKLVWELNRHHHLVVLARAYRVTGEERFAREVRSQVLSWLEQCPYGRGMNWRSPLELAIRLINWVWAFELVRPSGVTDDAFLERLLPSVHLHLREITRNYSRYSSANNHLIGEAAGVYLATAYFSGLVGSADQRRRARQILIDQMQAQVNADGGNKELAFGYHLFVLQFFVLAGLCGRRLGEGFPDAYWQRLERMFEFAAAIVEGGRPVMFGDCDDGYVLDLGGERPAVDEWLTVGSVLFRHAGLKQIAPEFSETAFWLLGPGQRETFEQIIGKASSPLESRSFPETGLYLLQRGTKEEGNAVSVMFDCGPLGFGPLAAHGHADALSFTLRVSGEDIFVDPGTYDYFRDPTWRNYFRSTRAHNTIEIDGQDQSEMLGAFLWGRRAESRCLEWSNEARETRVIGRHDGYARTDDPVEHVRAICLDRTSGEIMIEDTLAGRAGHDVCFRLHVADACRVAALGGNTHRVSTQGIDVIVTLPGELSVAVEDAGDGSAAGWISRAYHAKSAGKVLVGRTAFQGKLTLRTSMRIAMREGTRDRHLN